MSEEEGNDFKEHVLRFGRYLLLALQYGIDQEEAESEDNFDNLETSERTPIAGAGDVSISRNKRWTYIDRDDEEFASLLELLERGPFMRNLRLIKRQVLNDQEATINGTTAKVIKQFYTTTKIILNQRSVNFTVALRETLSARFRQTSVKIAEKIKESYKLGYLPLSNYSTVYKTLSPNFPHPTNVEIIRSVRENQYHDILFLDSLLTLTPRGVRAFRVRIWTLN